MLLAAPHIDPVGEELGLLVEGFDSLVWAIHRRHKTSPHRQLDFDSGDNSYSDLLSIGAIGKVLNLYC